MKQEPYFSVIRICTLPRIVISMDFFFFFFLQVFLSNVADEEAGIAQVANINQLPGTDGYSSPLKDAVMNTSSFFILRAELSIFIHKKACT